MSASRFFSLLIAFTLLTSGCAYDPQIAAQYSKDGEGEAIVGPQLPAPGKPSASQLQYNRKHGITTPQGSGETAAYAGAVPNASKETSKPKPAEPTPAIVSDNGDLTLPKQDASASDSAPLTAPAPEKTEVKVEEKIVVDVTPPPVETPKPAVTPQIVEDVATPPPAATASATTTASVPVEEKTATPEPEKTPATPAPQPAPATDSQEEQVAVIETKFGQIVIEFDAEAAPVTVDNFKKLAKDGFYNGTTFHRVIPDFMIQGGDPNSKGDDRTTHGKGGPDYTLQAEIKLKHKRGSVAMARLPNNVNPLKSSNGSQFYICIIDCPFLDGEYTVFGHVISGMEVVDRISAQPRDDHDNPLQRIDMKVSLEPKSKVAESTSP